MDLIRLSLLSSVSQTALTDAGDIPPPPSVNTFDRTDVTFDQTDITWDSF